MKGRGHLDKSLNEEAALFVVSTPDLFPRLVCMPELPRVEEIDSSIELLPVVFRKEGFVQFRSILSAETFLGNFRRSIV